MADYERSTVVNAVPDAVFDWLSDPKNMPNYVATMTRATPSDGGLAVAASVVGRGTEEGQASFSADPGARRLTWGREGHDYHGQLDVADNGGGGSKVTIKLHTHGDEDSAQTEDALQKSLANIQMAVEQMA